MQRPRYAAAASSVCCLFAFALLEVPLAWVRQRLYLAGVALDPTAAAFSCPGYDDSCALRARAPLQQFDFTRVPAGCWRADSDIVRALAVFDHAVEAAIRAHPVGREHPGAPAGLQGHGRDPLPDGPALRERGASGRPPGWWSRLLRAAGEALRCGLPPLCRAAAPRVGPLRSCLRPAAAR